MTTPQIVFSSTSLPEVTDIIAFVKAEIISRPQ
jgi:hypothetical protein